jgi:hypothetical protein
MSDIHSCSYYCTRPACVLAQRDELRDRLHKQAEPVVEPHKRATVGDSGQSMTQADDNGNPSF